MLDALLSALHVHPWCLGPTLQAVQEMDDAGRPRKLLPIKMAMATAATQWSMVEASSIAKAQSPPHDIPADQRTGFK